MPTTPRQHPQSQPQSLRNRGLWQSYAALSPQTRLRLSLGVCTVALIGIFVSDMLEESLPPPPQHKLQNHSTSSTPETNDP